MSFRQLAHARALAAHGNFRLAAAELHISQPALTRSIKALEAALQARLFDRLSSGVEPTPAGAVLLRRATRILQEREDMELELAAFLGLASGSLVVSTGPYPGDALVPDTIAALMQRAPDIACRIKEVDWSDIPGQLLSREIDLAVADLSNVEGDDRFETELMIRDELYFVCRAQHPLAGKSRLGNGDFAEYPLVGSRVPERMDRYLGVRSPVAGGVDPAITFRVKVDVATFSAARRMVLGSDGIALAPLVHVANELLDGTMTILRSGQPALRLHAGLIRLKDRSPSPAAAQFVQELRRIKADADARTASLVSQFGL